MNIPQLQRVPEAHSGPVPTGWTPPAEPLRPFWTSPALKFGSIAAFVSGMVGVAATALLALDYRVGRVDMCGSDGCWWNQDSPAVSHDKLVHALSIGGLTLALFTLAVGLAVVQMRRNGLPLRLVQVCVFAAAVTTGIAVVFASLPATRPWGAAIGIASVASLVVCWVRIVQLPRRVWEAGA